MSCLNPFSGLITLGADRDLFSLSWINQSITHSLDSLSTKQPREEIHPKFNSRSWTWMKPKRNTSNNPWDRFNSLLSRYTNRCHWFRWFAFRCLYRVRSTRVMLFGILRIVVLVVLCAWLHTLINWRQIPDLSVHLVGLELRRWERLLAFFSIHRPPYLSLAEQYGRELTQLATATRPHLTIIVGFLPRIQVMYGARSKINMLQKSQAPPSKEDLLLRRTESHPKKVCILRT